MLNNFSTRNCELSMLLGPNMDDIVFNAPRLHADGDNRCGETLPFLDLKAQNVVFNSAFIGAIGPLGYTITDGSFTARPLIRIGRTSKSVTKFNGLFVETTKGTTNMTHIFGATADFNLFVSDLRINVDDPNNTARAVVYAQTRRT